MYITSGTQAFSHHPLTDAQLGPQAVEGREINSHHLQNSFLVISCRIFDQFKSAVLIMFPQLLGPFSANGLGSVQNCYQHL